MLRSLTSRRTNFDERLIMMSFTCQQTFKWLPAGPLEYLFYCKLNLKTGNATRDDDYDDDSLRPHSEFKWACLDDMLPACSPCLPAYLRHVIRWGFVSISYPVKTILITVAGSSCRAIIIHQLSQCPRKGLQTLQDNQAGNQAGSQAVGTDRDRDRHPRQAANSQRRPRSTGWLTDERFIEKFLA